MQTKTALIILGLVVATPLLFCGGCIAIGMVAIGLDEASKTTEERQTERLQKSLVNNAKPSALRYIGERQYDDQTMVLYVLNAEWSDSEFKQVCQSEKAKNTGSFRVVAVFDREANAVFPKNPPSAFYGSETQPLKHILASYTHNAINGFEETTPYNPQKVR